MLVHCRIARRCLELAESLPSSLSATGCRSQKAAIGAGRPDDTEALITSTWTRILERAVLVQL